MSKYVLENVIDRMLEGDSTIDAPDPSELELLQAGDIVKVIFLFDGEKKERMWVELKDASFPFFEGELDNESHYDKRLSAGAIIKIEAQHICDIYRED